MKKTRPLTLQRDTLRLLTDRLQAAAGGMTSSVVTTTQDTSERVSCFASQLNLCC